MRFNPEIHHRRTIRLPGYDYSEPGAYFVTLVTRGHECLFGEVCDGRVLLNKWGGIVHEEWVMSEGVRHEIALDTFVVMPNHLHGIVIIKDAGITGVRIRATGRSPLPISGPGKRSLGAFIAGFKSAATKRINIDRHLPGVPVWQRNYFEHIIRGETSLGRIREYIVNNPQQWELDRENPLSWLSRVQDRPGSM